MQQSVDFLHGHPGAGVPVQAVNQLLNQFEQMQKMMKMMKGGNLQRMMRGMKGMLPGLR